MFLGDVWMTKWIPVHRGTYKEITALQGAGTCHPRVMRLCGLMFSSSLAKNKKSAALSYLSSKQLIVSPPLSCDPSWTMWIDA